MSNVSILSSGIVVSLSEKMSITAFFLISFYYYITQQFLLFHVRDIGGRGAMGCHVLKKLCCIVVSGDKVHHPSVKSPDETGKKKRNIKNAST